MDAITLQLALAADPITYMFNCALDAGRSRKLKSLFTRRIPRLLDLSNVKSQSKGRRYAGRKEVALDDIRGTEGRLSDFDDQFNPLTSRTRQRWQSLAKAVDQGVHLPPVDLIQVGQVFYVRDGHHRISVARALGQTTITAEVMVWDVQDA